MEPLTGQWRTIGLSSLLGVLLSLCACSSSSSDTPLANTAAKPSPGDEKLLIIGQDLGAIRGYMASDCCPRPDGLTAYLGLYNILDESSFGGLGIDAQANPIEFDVSWGAGPVGAWQTATEFGIDGLAIGLFIAENNHPGALQQLIDGNYDDEIRHLARFFSLVKGPVYLRIGYEFDGAWNQGYENPEKFKAAYIRIVDVLREAQADNFLTVWHAAASPYDDAIDGLHEDITQWYPGDDYVDWMGSSWMMNPDETIQIESDYDPGTALEHTEELLAFARERKKPVMIAEATPSAMDLNEKFRANATAIWDGEPASGRVNMTNDEIWEYWFEPLFELLEKNRDVIHALAYINVDWDSQEMWGPPYAQGFWGDSRLESNDVLAARFSSAIDDWKAPRQTGNSREIE